MDAFQASMDEALVAICQKVRGHNDSLNKSQLQFEAYVETAWADGEITESEEKYLMRKAKEFMISEERARQIFLQVTT